MFLKGKAISRRAIMDAVDIVMVHGSLDGFRHAIREAVNIGTARTDEYAYAVKVAGTIAELGNIKLADVSRIMTEEKSR
jgi:hypothetical protein